MSETKRYIDAEEFKNGVMAAMTEQSAKDGALPLQIGMMLCHFADETPAADVQEVVRCKDCKFCHHYYDMANFDRYRCYAEYDTSVGRKPFREISIDVQADDYCSGGRR